MKSFKLSFGPCIAFLRPELVEGCTVLESNARVSERHGFGMLLLHRRSMAANDVRTNW
jgi:hypothetical protein